jgi:uncharacterized protein (DUF885 family)
MTDERFRDEFGEQFFDRFWQRNPDWALAIGYYTYADRLVVPDASARAAALREIERSLVDLRRIERATLTPAVRTDWEILENQLLAEQWALTELREWQWNPSLYNVAEPFALLQTLTFAPLDERLRLLSTRLQRVPAYYAAAKVNIESPTLEHTQLAIEQSRGALAVFGPELAESVAGSGLAPRERGTFAERLAAARSAIEDYVRWLERLHARLATGAAAARSFRLGAELYARKFAFEIQSGDSAEALYARALAEKVVLLARMTVLADSLWPKYFPNAATPQDPLDRIGRVIARIADDHVQPAELLREIERQIPELERWVREHDLLDLDPEKPLIVRETPPHKRGIAGAGIDAPGPYDAGAPTYYNVTPLDGERAARAESWLREYNRWMLPILNIHEAVPGHYVQLVYANRSPSLLKSIFANGAMIEGWAVYTERLMLESGYGEHRAEAWLIYSKWNLRSVCNTILDYGVHVLGMTEAEAIDLLTRQAFQTEAEATEKWRRVQLTSVQLTSYFSGYSAILELREQLKRERADAFELKQFHEELLSYGSAPVRVIRELMLDQS